MRSAQRSARAHRQHRQRPTRRVVARHRSADLPGQADGSHKHPSATYAALTRDTGERQRAPPSAPSAPRTRKSPPQCAAHSSAPAPPSEHTHIESTCRRSRRTPQVQFSLSTPHESSVAGQPATASGVAIIYVYLGAPGMSPTPRSAKYPATHSCHRLRGGGNARLLSSSPPTAEGRRCAAPIERQRATPSVSEADATTPPMVRASTSNPEGSECSEISDYGNYALRQRAAPSAATPPLCFLGRTFGTHSLYIALIPAQLRKCRAMIRSTRFGVPSSVAARCANRQPPPLLFTLIHSSSHPLIHSKLRFYFDFPLVCTIFR